MTERDDPEREQTNPGRLADELEQEADRLDERSGELEDEIQDARDDWRRKRSDESVPGADPIPQEVERDAPGDETNPADAGRGRDAEQQREETSTD